ncbi:uncharacterized protein ARMOST_01855 [Armillaria ostoyae]|uniref:Uncharacterized protein n=1 Tax=Armillaria ostoyae TaxID=47428 RepID=A0A284QQ42_ARMOS|nr:uncharacterized protein ARMOST_01855 [Armillaria ostoyae]
MGPAVDSSSREIPSEHIDDPTFAFPAQEVQLENVTQPSDNPPVKEPVEEAARSEKMETRIRSLKMMLNLTMTISLDRLHYQA